jgi:uncharacterized protein
MTTFDWQAAIDRHYPADSKCREILMRHSQQVADKALKIAHEHNLPLDDSDITAAAMIHDIGIFLTNAPGIDCHGEMPYMCHGCAGADLLRCEDAPEWLAHIAECHTGAGILPEEITLLNLPLPQNRDYMPRTLLEQLICYADKYYSKSGDMQEKSLDRVRASMAKHGSATLNRFESLRQKFEGE